jgi:2-succinyl-5-enolpyruvyl-6-hydroxy-3-cyclohexene-1-carboxylate synthase
MNLTLAARVIEFVRAKGVVDFCLCAGARNSPFITLLDENKSTLEKEGQLLHFFEERSAAFFALGRAQQSQRPVAVITTSGTAATELISAAVEAYYTQTPLIFITADRPPSYRGTGAPQAIEQLGIFSHYSYPTIDLFENTEALKSIQWNHRIPLHLNVCFAEPLIDEPIPTLNVGPTPPWRSAASLQAVSGASQSLDRFFSKCQNPLLILSGLQGAERDYVAQHIARFGGVAWVESLSGLCGHPDVEALRLRSGERYLQSLMSSGQFDGVIRIGAVPTTRLWRDLEDKFRFPVLSLTDAPWTGLARASERAPLGYFSRVTDHYGLNQEARQKRAHLQRKDALLCKEIAALCERHPCSELAMVRQLSTGIGKAPLYLGNSLPVRHWDWLSEPHWHSSIHGNRGANGIDGQISSFLGWLPEEEHSWAVLGDLTAMYDLSAPWIVPKLKNQNFTLVILNNGGGQIFKPMFGREAFLNRHSFEFSGWANMWNLRYASGEKLDQDTFTNPPQILELRPSELETAILRAEIENLWKQNL